MKKINKETCLVHIVPHPGARHVHGISIRKDNNLVMQYPRSEEDHNQANYSHIYITFGGKLFEGDLVYNELSGVGEYLGTGELDDDCLVKYFNEEHEVSEDEDSIRKIVSTTDPEVLEKAHVNSTGKIGPDDLPHVIECLRENNPAEINVEFVPHYKIERLEKTAMNIFNKLMAEQKVKGEYKKGKFNWPELNIWDYINIIR